MGLLEKMIREEAEKAVGRKIHSRVSDALVYLDDLFWSDADNLAVAKLEMAGPGAYASEDRPSEYDYRLSRADAIVRAVQRALEEFHARPLSDLRTYLYDSGPVGRPIDPVSAPSTSHGHRSFSASSPAQEVGDRLPLDLERVHSPGETP